MSNSKSNNSPIAVESTEAVYELDNYGETTGLSTKDTEKLKDVIEMITAGFVKTKTMEDNINASRIKTMHAAGVKLIKIKESAKLNYRATGIMTKLFNESCTFGKEMGSRCMSLAAMLTKSEINILSANGVSVNKASSLAVGLKRPNGFKFKGELFDAVCNRGYSDSDFKDKRDLITGHIMAKKVTTSTGKAATPAIGRGYSFSKSGSKVLNLSKEMPKALQELEQFKSNFNPERDGKQVEDMRDKLGTLLKVITSAISSLDDLG